MSDLGNLNLTPPTPYSTDPILEYVFDTPEEASNQALIWGCSGYRTYLINGSLKYVPCKKPSDYIEATQLYIHQGDIVAQGKEVFGDKLVGYQFTEKDNIKGDPIYTLGNFSIATNITEKQDTIVTLSDSRRSYSGIDFSIDGIAKLKSRLIKSVQANVKFDRSNLEKYVTYASLRERFRVAIQEIAETFPASMHVIPYSIENTSVFDYYTETNGASSMFKVRLNDINNPFNIDYFKSGITKPQDEYISPLRNFSKNYSKYEIYYNDVAYKIISIIAPEDKSDVRGLILTVEGNPFEDVVSINHTANVDFYIKPVLQSIGEFYDNVTQLTGYLLNPKSIPLYTSIFKVPHRTEEGKFVITEKVMTFPMLDGYNIDLWGDLFTEYMGDLNYIADEFDLYKTDLVARFLTTESLQEFDTDDRRAYVVMQAYGAMFDSVKQYADGIAYMTNVSYDKIDNVPDILLKNFANTLGWKTYEIEKDETLIEALFEVQEDRQGDDTPAEIDIELWRRIVINSFYIFKSKGTRKSLEFALELVGIPLEIMDINEYVYVADHALDYDYYYSVYNTALSKYPVDDDGYPTTPPNLYFQAYGGSMLNDAQNVGEYDNGQAYIDTYRSFNTEHAFDLIREVDNKKAWVNTTGVTDQTYDLLLRNTNYTIKDSRLVINTKEADAYLSTQMTFDYYVYSFYAKYDYKLYLGSTEMIDPSKLTFNEYLSEVFIKLIDPQNRKVVRKYPVLSKIYWDYLGYAEDKNLESIDFSKTLGFLSKFDTYWVKLLQQFVPATTIFTAGKKHRNAEIGRDKFQYKHGLNNSKNWLGTDGSEFQDDGLKPTPGGVIGRFDYDGYLCQKPQPNDTLLKMNMALAPKATSFLNGFAKYDSTKYDYYKRWSESLDYRYEYPSGDVITYWNGYYGYMNTFSIGRARDVYFYTKNASTWLPYPYTGDDPKKIYFSGTTEDLNYEGDSKYAGFITLASIVDYTTQLTLDELPTDETSLLYPLRMLYIFGLHDIPVEVNQEYIFDGDMLFDFNVSGNSENSYIGVIPIYSDTVNDPPQVNDTYFLDDYEILEGCKGIGKYDKYNWIHLKTKFTPQKTLVNVILVGYDITYTGTTSHISVSDFNISLTSEIDFITPPPMPNICHYDGQFSRPITQPLISMHNYLDFSTLSQPWDFQYWTVYPPTRPAPEGGIRNGITYVRIPMRHKNTWTLTNTFSYTIDPPYADTLYYYTFKLRANYTGEELTYEQQPTIYFKPFDGESFKFKCSNVDGEYIKYEGYHNPSEMPADPHVVFICESDYIDLDDYEIEISEVGIYKVHLYYIDDDGDLSWYKQPTYFGYSKNTDSNEPSHAIGGVSGSWVVPYVPSAGISPDPLDVPGMYQPYIPITALYVNPLFHVTPTYVKKYDLGVEEDEININLTHSCGLEYKFHLSENYPISSHPTYCLTKRGNTIDNQLFIEEGWDITFDGFYPTTGTTHLGLGPTYKSRDYYGLYATIGGTDVLCYTGTNNYIPQVNNYASTNFVNGESDGETDGGETPNTVSGTFVQIFDATSDWGNPVDRKYSINFEHNLESINLIIELWDETTGMLRTDVDSIENVDMNHTKITVHEIPDLRFKGRIVIYKSGSDAEYVSFSNLPDSWVENHEVPRDFNSALSTVSQANLSNNQYVAVNKYSLVKVEGQLIYDSDIDAEQTVLVKLMGADNFVYNQQEFLVGGSNNPNYTSLDSRTLTYEYEGYYYGNDEIYVVMEPTTHDCYIKPEEVITVDGIFQLSGGTGSTLSYFIGETTIPDEETLYFTGDTYNYMINGIYDVLQFTPTGVSGHTDGSVDSSVYSKELNYYMAYNSTTQRIVLQSQPIDVTQYGGDENKFKYGITQIPAPYSGTTWYTYTSGGDKTEHYSNALTGNTFNILRKSYVKIYESDVIGITPEMENRLISVYFKDDIKEFKFGYNTEFFDNPINRFYVTSDDTEREVFEFGKTEIQYKEDGLYLTYVFEKDLAGYPVCGEFMGRLTIKDPCGNIVTTYFLLCLDIKDNTAINKSTNYKTNSQIINVNTNTT